MKENGKITKITDCDYIVSIDRHASCGSCSTKDSCFGSDNKVLEITVSKIGDYKIGDIVTLELETKKLLTASFLTYIMPLALMVGAAILPRFICNNPSEALYSLFGFSGLATGFFILWFINKSAEKKKIFNAKISGLAEMNRQHP